MEEYIVKIERDFDQWGNANVLIDDIDGRYIPYLNKIVGKNLADRLKEEDLNRIMNHYENRTGTGLIKVKHCLDCPEKVKEYISIINKHEYQRLQSITKRQLIDKLIKSINLFIESEEGFYIYDNTIIYSETSLDKYIDKNSLIPNYIPNYYKLDKELIHVFYCEIDYWTSEHNSTLEEELKNLTELLELNNIKGVN